MKRTDVFVYCELAGAELAEVGLEMLGPAAKMAEKYGGCACAVLIGGGDLDKAAAQAALYGAGRVIEVSGDEYAEYSCDAYTHALTELCRKYEPAALMIGSTPLGRDLAPRVACRLKTGLTADVTDISFNDELGCINWIMPAYGGQMLASIVCAEKMPQMGTIRPGVFPAAPVSKPAEADVIREDIRFDAADIRTKLIKIIKAETGGAKLRDAEVVVAGGYGCRDREGFALVEQLAGVLGGAVGASRAAIDAGWAPAECQIGQSGVTVKPKLYIACGISGAIQHTAGMDKAGTIIAINPDPEAPIFSIADIGIREELQDFIPCLIRALSQEK